MLLNFYFLYIVVKFGENMVKILLDRIVKDGSGMRYECALSSCFNLEMN